MKVNDVVSVVTPAGEFIGKLAEQTDSKIKLSDPRMLIHAGEGMGFAKGIAVSGCENPTEVEFFASGVVFMTPSNDDVQKAYRKMTSGIIL
jgi:hypothetical protein